MVLVDEPQDAHKDSFYYMMFGGGGAVRQLTRDQNPQETAVALAVIDAMRRKEGDATNMSPEGNENEIEPMEGREREDDDTNERLNATGNKNIVGLNNYHVPLDFSSINEHNIVGALAIPDGDSLSISVHVDDPIIVNEKERHEIEKTTASFVPVVEPTTVRIDLECKNMEKKDNERKNEIDTLENERIKEKTNEEEEETAALFPVVNIQMVKTSSRTPPRNLSKQIFLQPKKPTYGNSLSNKDMTLCNNYYNEEESTSIDDDVSNEIAALRLQIGNKPFLLPFLSHSLSAL